MFGLPQFHGPAARAESAFRPEQLRSDDFRPARHHGRPDADGLPGGRGRADKSGEAALFDQGALAASFDFMKTAKGVVADAVKTLARDVAKTLGDFGLGGEEAAGLVKGLVQPLFQALRDGADFVAQVSFAAIQKTTVVTDKGAAQSVSLVARQLDIAVNQSTGEFSVQVKSLDFEQKSVVAFQGGGGAQQGFQFPALQAPGVGGDLPGLGELLEQMIGKAREAAGLPPEGEPGQGRQVFDPPVALLPALAPAGEPSGGSDALAAQADPLVRMKAARTALLLQSVERSRNEAGEQITRLGLEARISIAQVLEERPEAVERLAKAGHCRHACDTRA